MLRWKYFRWPLRGSASTKVLRAKGEAPMATGEPCCTILLYTDMLVGMLDEGTLSAVHTSHVETFHHDDKSTRSYCKVKVTCVLYIHSMPEPPCWMLQCAYPERSQNCSSAGQRGICSQDKFIAVLLSIALCCATERFGHGARPSLRSLGAMGGYTTTGRILVLENTAVAVARSRLVRFIIQQNCPSQQLYRHAWVLKIITEQHIPLQDQGSSH
jgi:hypothetical protein